MGGTGRSEGPGIRPQSDYCRSHEVYPAAHRIQPVMHLRTASTEIYRLQLRMLYEVIYGKALDVRNFHKKISMMEYIVPTEEYEQEYLTGPQGITGLTGKSTTKQEDNFKRLYNDVRIRL